jgi:ketosteroid isomerase-like protein
VPGFPSAIASSRSRTPSVLLFSAAVAYLFLVRSLGLVLEDTMEEELVKLENEFARAVANNDADTLDVVLANDWIIVDPDGSIINKARFLGAIRSGVLSHESMESTDLRVRLYGSTAVVTGLTTTKGKFMGQDFASCERATDIFAKQTDRWQCVFTQLTRFTNK